MSWIDSLQLPKTNEGLLCRWDNDGLVWLPTMKHPNAPSVLMESLRAIIHIKPSWWNKSRVCPIIRDIYFAHPYAEFSGSEWASWQAYAIWRKGYRNWLFDRGTKDKSWSSDLTTYKKSVNGRNLRVDDSVPKSIVCHGSYAAAMPLDALMGKADAAFFGKPTAEEVLKAIQSRSQK